MGNWTSFLFWTVFQSRWDDWGLRPGHKQTNFLLSARLLVASLEETGLILQFFILRCAQVMFALRTFTPVHTVSYQIHTCVENKGKTTWLKRFKNKNNAIFCKQTEFTNRFMKCFWAHVVTSLIHSCVHKAVTLSDPVMIPSPVSSEPVYLWSFWNISQLPGLLLLLFKLF